MTREDLRDWILAHGCKAEPFPERNNTASCVMFVNPSRNGKAYIDSPIDGRPVKDFTAYMVCTHLRIRCPDHVLYCANIHNSL